MSAKPKAPKSKTHCFVVAAKDEKTDDAAKTALLVAFAKRQPDGCEFHVTKIGDVRDAWMDGAKSGVQTTFSLVTRTLEKMRAEFTK